MHVALRFAYDGSAFASYARQPTGGTVEDHLLAALAKEGYVHGSWRTGSRTDRGVSALENVAACKVERPHVRGLVPALNAGLPDGLWVTGAASVAADWNPRHAVRRTYEYVAPNAGEDLATMQATAEVFCGTHDMRAFARMEPERTPRRTVERFQVEAVAGGWRFTVEGPSFLWNQVRRMVAALLDAGDGRLGPDDVAAALLGGDAISGLAPPEGLLLARVEYADAPAWDAGGRPGPKNPGRAWQAAKVRHRVAEHVRAISSA